MVFKALTMMFLKRKINFKRLFLRSLLGFFIVSVFLVVIANLIIKISSHRFLYKNISDVPVCYTAIVLGAKVSNTGYLSDFLQDRVDVAIELYKNKKISRFLLSGDHGRKNYDEVNSMKNYLLAHGIDTKDIFLDHAGFDTYNSMYRANYIFKIEKAIIVSQEFHLSRAVYIARKKGIEAYGIKADRQDYSSLKQLKVREKIANVKAFLEVIVNKKPKFFGPSIPITGDTSLSYD